MEPIEEGEEHAPFAPSTSSKSGEREEMLTMLQYSEETEARSEVVVVSRESPIRRLVIGATANGLAPAADMFREGGRKSWFFFFGKMCV